MRDARIELELGNADAALEALRSAAEAYPRELLPVLELWRLHRDHPLPEPEANSLRETLARRVADPHAPLPPGVLRYLAGLDDLETDELEVILAAAQQRLTGRSENAELLRSVASLQQRLGRADAHRATIGRLLAVDNSDSVRWHCIRLDIAGERWESAASLLQPLVSREAPSLAARLAYVSVLSKLGRLDELGKQLEVLEGTHGINRATVAQLLLAAAWGFRDAGEDAEAESTFRRALALRPDHVETREALLYLYGSAEEREQYEASKARTWEREPDAAVLLQRGSTLLSAGDATGALPLLERAAGKLRDSEIAWYNVGLAAFHLERWEQAQEAFAKAATLNPDRADSYLNRGIALHKLDRCVDAVPVLDQVLALQPGAKRAHYYLWTCHAALGHADEAREHLRLYNAAR